MHDLGDLQKVDRAASARARLLDRIHRLGYETAVKALDIGPLNLPFMHIADPDRVLDRVAEEQDRLEKIQGRTSASSVEPTSASSLRLSSASKTVEPRTPGDQLHLPYWAELWDSGLAIGAWLTENDSLLPDSPPSVLDLGCGMGLAGTVAARLGMRVLFADLEAPALLFARLNSLPDAARVRTRCLNWRHDRLDETFDLIIGADILYEREQWDFLEPFWRAHLKPRGILLLGEPGRQTGDAFPQWIEQRGGWVLRQHARRVPTRSVPIRLFELRQKENAPD